MVGLIFSGFPGFSAADAAVATLNTNAAVAASKINPFARTVVLLIAEGHLYNLRTQPLTLQFQIITKRFGF
jgi:hypothetical protein